MAKVNEDLIKERKKCTFDIKELIHIIDGGEEFTQERKHVGKYKVFISIKVSLV